MTRRLAVAQTDGGKLRRRTPPHELGRKSQDDQPEVDHAGKQQPLRQHLRPASGSISKLEHVVTTGTSAPLSIHIDWNACTDRARSVKNSDHEAVVEANMNIGHHRHGRPDRGERRSAEGTDTQAVQPDASEEPVTWVFPRAQRTRCFQSAASVFGSSAEDDRVAFEENVIARELDPERRHGVLGERRRVELDLRGIPAPRGVISCAPPARQACAPKVFWARRAAACAVMYSNRTKRLTKFAGMLGALLDVCGHPADHRVAEVSRHPPQRGRG